MDVCLMGHGAPKTFDSIPVSTVVTLLAHEANVRDAMEKLGEALKECLEGSENPYHWAQLDVWRGRAEQRTRDYFRAIMALGRQQNKG